MIQPFTLWATHNRAGEITLRQISELTYEIKITTFTYTLSAADRNQLEVQWGDGTTSWAPRDTLQYLPNNYKRNVYFARHTYPGPGTYEVIVQDPNRNFGVLNIPNSVNVIFSINTIITINPDIGQNNTPVLLNPPIDKAARGQIFIHNPAAFDFEGDSISYERTVCTKENGLAIENYTFPDSVYVDPVTGDFIWNYPKDTGIYNFAMNIIEWRDGVKIGRILRDMQVEVYNTRNNPPVNDSLADLCVIAGTRVEYVIKSTDKDGDNLKHFITGGPFAFNDNSASYEVISSKPGELISLFTWETSCIHPRQQPYSIIVKTEDNNPELSLVDIDNLNIKVLGPPPAPPEVRPSSVSTNLSWEKYVCPQISGYKIYRKTGKSDYAYDACTPGLPPSSGFELIGTTDSHGYTTFFDNNKGTGLMQGLDYCYRITAILPDGSESFPSEESCAALIPGYPGILNTSVVQHGTNGSIFLSWAKPVGLDTLSRPANGPYTYLIYRSNDLWGDKLALIDSINTSDLNDTTYLDSGINTDLFPYSYSIELYNNTPGDRFRLGEPEIASSFYPDIEVQDNALLLNIRRNVPWLNTEYTIYRSNSYSGTYDSIGTSNEEFFLDDELKNGEKYCYYIRSKGQRELYNIHYINENISHRNCAIPQDNTPPCPPQLNVASDCMDLYNQLSWFYSSSQEECSEDVIYYNIYYTPDLDIEHIVLDTVQGRSNQSYTHIPKGGLAASYFITAVDSFGNESIPSAVAIIDTCKNYSIPNVFTPNGDGKNDILQPDKIEDVEKIDLTIFNRWGQTVFETNDPFINWNGKYKNTEDLVSPGVYYYICDVYERRITGIEVRNIVGFIHVFHEKGAQNVDGEY